MIPYLNATVEITLNMLFCALLHERRCRAVHHTTIQSQSKKEKYGFMAGCEIIYEKRILAYKQSLE